MTLLDQLWREHGLTMVIVTHDTSVAHRARKLGLMRDGRLEIRPTALRDPAAAGLDDRPPTQPSYR
jgi:putative ABC transport system ATP-binding protein